MKLNLDIPLNELSKKELEILQYIHDNSADIINMSIQEFANNIHYSTSTVLRFCRKIGYSGFPELKFYLKSQNQNITKKTNFEQSVSSIKKSIISDLRSTATLLNIDELIQISSLLSSNNSIYFHSPGGLTDIAISYFENMLFMSGCQYVYKSTANKMTKHYIRTLEKGNVFIFISNSGNFETTLNLAKEAKLHGMTIISISSISNNDLAEVSDYNIRFYSKSKENEGADFTSRLDSFFVLGAFISFFNSHKKGINYEDIS